MYYLQLDKDPVYPHQSPGPRHTGLSLSPQGYGGAPQYSDFTGYHPHAHHAHHHHGLNPDLTGQQPGGAGPGPGWSAAYPGPPPPRDDWSSQHPVGPGLGGPGLGGPGLGAPGLGGPGLGPPPLGFSPPEFSGQPGLLSTSLNGSAGPLGPSGSPQRRNPYDWIRRSAAPPSNTNGKTRTKDKYRVVYTDHQRLELEKEFHYSKYITIRRKAELATTLGLSERQVKIWFQNRRAKERKINKKKLQQPASSTTTATPPGGGGGGGGGGGVLLHGNGGSSAAMVTSSSGSNGMVSPSSLPLSIKEEY
ncbi:homeobox protein CDX-1-like [Clinocottus analis]|uniref:homeobox protein CDX-1-like n=1 Tax=Clinocottus analis TaxID=304258 RepID=UPI0035C2598B